MRYEPLQGLKGLTDAITRTASDLLTIRQLLASTEVDEVGIVTSTCQSSKPSSQMYCAHVADADCPAAAFARPLD